MGKPGWVRKWFLGEQLRPCKLTKRLLCILCDSCMHSNIRDRFIEYRSWIQTVVHYTRFLQVVHTLLYPIAHSRLRIHSMYHNILMYCDTESPFIFFSFINIPDVYYLLLKLKSRKAQISQVF